MWLGQLRVDADLARGVKRRIIVTADKEQSGYTNDCEGRDSVEAGATWPFQGAPPTS